MGLRRGGLRRTRPRRATASTASRRRTARPLFALESPGAYGNSGYGYFAASAGGIRLSGTSTVSANVGGAHGPYPIEAADSERRILSF